jgi:hypothetical protein
MAILWELVSGIWPEFRLNDSSFLLNMCQLYVPGQLESTDNVLVDIGTGYFASKVGICNLPTTPNFILMN